MAKAQKALTDKMEKMVKASEKRIIDQQIKIKRILEGKFNTAVEQVDERHRLLKEQTEKSIKDLVEKMEASNSEVVKALTTLHENTNSFNSQYQTSFAKHLSDADKRIEELTVAHSRSAAIAQAEPMAQPSQGGESAASKSQALVTQALVTAALKTQAQGTTTTAPKTTFQTTILGRPPFIPTISTAGPAFGTTTTTKEGGSSSRPQGNVLRIAPYMEQVHKEREDDYMKMLMINNIAHENQTWTAELITAIGFNDFTVLNRLPLRSLETKSRISRQLDLHTIRRPFPFFNLKDMCRRKS
ncbi:hypothetical protein L1887_14751 [Cichorium endivia]|nr:hypothetical protein L1887_14751 [Cichorium endivia]